MACVHAVCCGGMHARGVPCCGSVAGERVTPCMWHGVGSRRAMLIVMSSSLFEAWRLRMGARANGAAPPDAIASTYDAYFDDVFDLASRLSASREEAAAIARAASMRLVEGRMVRARGGDGARFVASAYHEAAAMSDRAMQPASAGTHTLDAALVAGVNAHATRCKTCRRWGALEFSGQSAAPSADPILRAQVWRDVAPVVDARALSFELTQRMREPDQRSALRQDRWRWLIAAGTAAVIVLTALAVGVLTLGGGDGDGRANLEAFASGGATGTPPAPGAGAATGDAAKATSGGSDAAADDARGPGSGDAAGDGATTGAFAGTRPGERAGDVQDAPSSGDGSDGGSGAGGSSGGAGGTQGNGGGVSAPAGTPPAGASGEGTAVSAPVASSKPMPVATPPPPSTPVPQSTATSAPPPPEPTQPPVLPPPPEPTPVVDVLPLVPTVVGALPTLPPLPPLLGQGN